jgi:threonine dehydrogenase-like Zn-dependent dehydrogenase
MLDTFTPPVARGPLRSRRPAKQLLWLWVREDMHASRGFSDGLDLACGDMSVKPFFQTTNYVGIDRDAARLELAAAKHPDATAIAGKIEDNIIVGDFVLCLQTIGFNRLFEESRTLPTVEKLVESVRPGGTLIFNTGRPCQIHRQEINSRLRTSFNRVTARDYGALNSELPKWLSLLVAKAMYHGLTLRGSGFTYYVCVDRS